MFFRPLKLLLAISSLPKIDSLASDVVRLLKADSEVPVFSLITSSTLRSLGGVSKGTGGYFVNDVLVALGMDMGDTLVEVEVTSRLDKVVLELRGSIEI